MNNTIAFKATDHNYKDSAVHYDYYITGEDGKPLAYKIKDEHWVIFDADAALTKCMETIKNNKK